MQVIGARLVMLQVEGCQFEFRHMLDSAESESMKLRSDLWVRVKARRRGQAAAGGGRGAQEGRGGSHGRQCRA